MSINIQSRYRGSSDISMRHSDTVVGVIQNNGSVTPYRVRGVGGNQSTPTLVVRKMDNNHGGQDEYEIELNDPNLILDRPDCGYANIKWRDKTYAVFYSTRALRQYKRSLVIGQLRQNVVGGLRSGVGLNHANNKALAAYHFFNDVFPRYPEALNALRTQRHPSMAFSDKFALCVHRTKGIVLYYKEELVGWVDSEDEIQLIPSKIHLQEQLTEVL